MSDHGFAARCLLRAASSATLATQADGQPFASLVTHAVTPDGTLLLWLSTLSQHTRQLLRDPRCALMAQGVPVGANPQTTPRVTVTGRAERAGETALKVRWLRRHPYAAQYAEFGDFALWRIVPEGGLLVGGFAAAHRLRARDLMCETSAIAAEEADIIEGMTAQIAPALSRLAGAVGSWRMIAVDGDGFDLTDGERTVRHAFPAPVTDREGVFAAIRDAVRLSHLQ